jgi:hypothetical protein
VGDLRFALRETEIGSSVQINNVQRSLLFVNRQSSAMHAQSAHRTRQEHSRLPAQLPDSPEANGENVKILQESLRHAHSRITLDTYTQATTPKR